MAQLHFDIDHDTQGPVTPSANAETLTNAIRLVFNDDVTGDKNKKDQLVLAAARAVEFLTEYMSAIQNKS